MPDDAPILVATDLSCRSDRAVQRAFRLARETGRPLMVLTVLDDALPEEMIGPLRERAAARLQRLGGSLGDDVAFSVRVETGDPTGEILRQVHGVAPVLLVAGVHRSGRFLDALRETTIQRVVRHGRCPVLMVRDAPDHAYRRILSAMDFSSGATAALRLAARLWPEGRISVLHALHLPYSGGIGAPGAGTDEIAAGFVRDARAEDAAWRDRTALPANVAAETRIEIGGACGVIRRIVETEAFELVCVGAHGRVGALPSVLGSLTLDLIRDPPCDLLIARS